MTIDEAKAFVGKAYGSWKLGNVHVIVMIDGVIEEGAEKEPAEYSGLCRGPCFLVRELIKAEHGSFARRCRARASVEDTTNLPAEKEVDYAGAASAWDALIATERAFAPVQYRSSPFAFNAYLDHMWFAGLTELEDLRQPGEENSTCPGSR